MMLWSDNSPNVMQLSPLNSVKSLVQCLLSLYHPHQNHMMTFTTANPKYQHRHNDHIFHSTSATYANVTYTPAPTFSARSKLSHSDAIFDYQASQAQTPSIIGKKIHFSITATDSNKNHHAISSNTNTFSNNLNQTNTLNHSTSAVKHNWNLLNSALIVNDNHNHNSNINILHPLIVNISAINF